MLAAQNAAANATAAVHSHAIAVSRGERAVWVRAVLRVGWGDTYVFMSAGEVVIVDAAGHWRPLNVNLRHLATVRIG